MLSVRYRPSEGSLRNGDVTGYKINYTRVDSGISQMITVNGGNTVNSIHQSYQDWLLLPTTQYKWLPLMLMELDLPVVL